MTRNKSLWLVLMLMLAALAATLLIEPRKNQAVAVSEATSFGWTAQLDLTAGDGIGGSRDGSALQARFADPWGVAVGGDGALYVADAGDNNRIRRIGRDGQVTTLAGSVEGFLDGEGKTAAFHTPSGLAIDCAGDLYVADTGNHAIRKVTAQGVVTTLAGTGVAGFRDGSAAQAQFNGPVGVAVDAAGRVYVADTYNDRIRVIEEGQVRTLAGGERPGYRDGSGLAARFDTPTALAMDASGDLWIADTRNDAIRKLSRQGEVSTLSLSAHEDPQPRLRRPLGLAATREGVLYVGEMSGGRVLQISRAGAMHVLTGAAQEQRLSRPAGVAIDAHGALYVSDAGSARIHRIAPADGSAAMPAAAMVGPAPDNPLPRTEGRWPLSPQQGWHEVVGTLGEVRGDFDGESRHHLHGGLDIRGDIGQEVLAIADGKVSSPSGAWGFGGQGEGIGVDGISYVHMRVGRTAQERIIDPARFALLLDDAGQPERIRVPRGTRFKAGDVLGTINRMAHVHLSVGASGFERNAVALGFRGYADSYAPRIDRIELLDAMQQPLPRAEGAPVRVSRNGGGVQIVVDAWDQVDRNLQRRRLGLHALGFQILDARGTPLPGYEAPRMNIEFNRMPADQDAVKIAYAPGSGITVHGSAATHFRYVVTNTVRDGKLAQGVWLPDELPPGDYLVRITARDYSGNVAIGSRDLEVRLE